MPAGNLLSQEIIDIYQQYVGDIKHDFTRTPIVVVWVEDSVECPNCEYDSINKCSLNIVKSGGIPFTRKCPTCSGRGSVSTIQSTSLKGTIYYPVAGQLAEQEAGGIYEEGACEISCILSECYHNSGTYSGKLYFDFAKYLEFDNRRWIVNGKPVPGGLGEDFTLTINLKKTDKVIK